MFSKILIANRGEIACRVMCAARALSLSFAFVASSLAGPSLAAEDEHLRAAQLEDALDQFASICLSTFPDKSRFDAAVRTSAWSFAPRATPDQQTHDEWEASRGVAYYIGAGGAPSGKALPQCNLDFAIPTALDRVTIAGRVEARLMQAYGPAPVRGQDGKFIFWEWPQTGRNVARLYLVQFEGADPRALTLTLQFWTRPFLRAPNKPDERGK